MCSAKEYKRAEITKKQVPRKIIHKAGRNFAKSVVIWRPEEPREIRVKLWLT